MFLRTSETCFTLSKCESQIPHYAMLVEIHLKLRKVVIGSYGM